jgi:hypothetical protein
MYTSRKISVVEHLILLIDLPHFDLFPFIVELRVLLINKRVVRFKLLDFLYYLLRNDRVRDNFPGEGRVFIFFLKNLRHRGKFVIFELNSVVLGLFLSFLVILVLYVLIFLVVFYLLLVVFGELDIWLG